jgi:hypothetical protein
MFQNRITDLFRLTNSPGMPTNPTAVATTSQWMPVVGLADIYQAAASRARNEHELDKLFNPEYYGDHGSGI